MSGQVINRTGLIKFKTYLTSLPELISISNGLRIAPNLERMSISDCPNLKCPSTDGCSHLTGTKGEVDVICRNLGLSGPKDCAIPIDAWRSSKAHNRTPRSRLQTAFLFADGDADESPRDSGGLAARVDSIELESGISILNGSRSYGLCSLEDRDRVTRCRTHFKHETAGSALNESRSFGDIFYAEAHGDCENREMDNAGGGIRGLRPPVLTIPPVMLRPVVDNVSSTWDLLNSLVRQEGLRGDKDSPVRFSNKDGDDEKVSKERTSQRKDDSDFWSSTWTSQRKDDSDFWLSTWTSQRKDDLDYWLSTSVDDEESEDKDVVGNILSATILGPVHNVSSNVGFRRKITSWQKGELLGSGSFGTVYEGITDDGFFFAVKEISLLDQGSQGKQSLLQLEQEIALLSQFQHENIVQYYGTDKDDKKLYIFLELMTKDSLATLYHKNNLRDSQASAYTRQILNGLKYLHDQNVVHRDIKCANILVDASGSVKLADFGLAKATNMDDAKSCKGTAFWMAPEVVYLKNRSYGLAADIWSLGCTVLEMLTRQPPYSPLEGMQALFRIGRGELPQIPDSLSRDARDFILRCLQVNPNDRPSAVQLLDHPFVRKPPTSSGFASPRFNNI